MSFQPKSRIGLGTNRLGQDPTQDLASLHYALDIGYRVIDTAERYMDQASETVIGLCLKQRKNFDRQDLQIITKVQPQNNVIDSCLGSLRRLNCDYVDLFLLHWRAGNDLECIVEQMANLQRLGYICNYGVSNFSVQDLLEWESAEHRVLGRSNLAANQIRYNFLDRSAEPTIAYHQQHKVVSIAHTPLSKGNALSDPSLQALAHDQNLTPAQAALRWILQTPGTVAVPKSTNPQRLRENLAVLTM